MNRRAAPLVAGKRPPAPRAQEAAYLRLARAALALWGPIARGLLERSRTELVTRADVERAWSGLVGSIGLASTLERMSRELADMNRSYFRRTLKAVPPQPDTRALREAFVKENVELWRKLGDEIADRMSEALRAPRLDAGTWRIALSVVEGLNYAPFYGGHYRSRAAAERRLSALLIERPRLAGANPQVVPSGLPEAGEGKRPPSASPADRARRENVALIKGLDDPKRALLTQALKVGQEQGVRHETLIETVQQITGYGESRAKLIARDQAVKHNAAVQEAQARAAGVTRYRWVCVVDEATRPMHKALNGQTFSYDNPPVTNKSGDRNNPGEDYQCRCQAAPVIDLFAGLSDE